MKRFLVSILFLLVLVFAMNAGKGICVSEEMNIPVASEDKANLQGEARPAQDELIAVLVIANSYADVSVAQSLVFGTNLMRRYRPAGFLFEKMFACLSTEKGSEELIEYRNIQHDTRLYSALLKESGYFVYGLCKIII